MVAVVGGIAIVVSASAGFAVAQNGDQPESGADPYAGLSAEEHQAVDEFCPSSPCRVVDVDAAKDGDAGGATPGEDLQADGIHAEDCPVAAAALNASGPPVDAFIGRCPTAAETAEIVRVQVEHPQLWEETSTEPPTSSAEPASEGE
jgi:hypothetical protein